MCELALWIVRIQQFSDTIVPFRYNTAMKRIYTSKTFDYSQSFAAIDFRERPEAYQIGRGEQGVLMVEPYKSEILPFWRFKTPEIAEESAQKIYELFLGYKEHNDFVGMDMARKFLQMGYTRSRRYANHKSGNKYMTNPQKEDSKKDEQKARTQQHPQEKDALTNDKAQSARIFYGYYLKAREDEVYIQLKQEHIDATQKTELK